MSTSEHNQDDQKVDKEPSHWLSQFGKRIGIGAGALVLLLLLIYLIQNYRWKNEYQVQLDRLKKQGFPVDGEDLEKRYNQKYPDQNPLYYPFSESFSDKVGLSELDKKFPPLKKDQRPPKRFTKEELSTIQNHLPEYKKWIAKFMSAKLRPPELQYRQGMYMEMPSILNNRIIAILLTYKGISEMRKGQYERAINLTIKMYKQAYYLMKPASIISCMTAYGVLEYAFYLHLKLLNQKGLSEEKIRTLQSTIKPDLIKRGYVWALKGDLATTHQSMKNNFSQGKNGKKKRVRGGTLNWLLRWKNRANYLRDMQFSIKHAKKPTYKGEKAQEKLEENIRERWTFLNMYSKILIPAISNSQGSRDKMYTKARLLTEASKIRLQQIKHGGFPKIYANISVITDPFTGKPCRVNVDEDWIRLFSAGTNKKYEDGAQDHDISIWLRKQPYVD